MMEHRPLEIQWSCDCGEQIHGYQRPAALEWRYQHGENPEHVLVIPETLRVTWRIEGRSAFCEITAWAESLHAMEAK